MSTEFYNRNWRMPKSSNSNKVSNYSMSFDGSSEYINFGNPTELQITGQLTLSCWVKVTASTGSNQAFIYKDAAGAGRSYKLQLQGSTNLVNFTIFNSGAPFHSYSTSTINDGNWHHISAVYTPSTSVVIYVDGVAETTNTTSVPASIDNDPAPFELGRRADGVFFLNGKIDHVAIFDYALSSSQVTSLYGNSTDGVGNPMELSTKPVAYYKIGDKATFNGSEYLVTNAASEVYSPYALDFDGTNDEIEFSTFVGSGEFTLSLWVKPTALNNNQNVLGFGSSGSNWINTSSTTLIRVKMKSGSPLNFIESGGNNLVLNAWNHILIYRDSSNDIGVFVNGATFGSTINNSLDINLKTIGRGTSTKFFEGVISNFSIWNAALTSTQVTELYNQGKPSNLNNHSAYSSLVSWWQLGENSSFDGTNWTVLDEKGTNNGTSVNMGEGATVNGVGTSANGLSDGMGGADNIIGDAPYSTGNAVSYGMGVDAKSTDVPS